jgi:hypothetical protein
VTITVRAVFTGERVSLNSVQQFVKSVLTGVTAPDFGPIHVAVAPPVGDVMDEPWLFIWGFRYRKERRTMGRPDAKKIATYDLYLWLKANLPAASDRSEEAFPLLLTAIENVLEQLPIPIQITDADTNVSTYITSIGEEFSVEYPGPRDVAGQSNRLYEAGITCTCIEDYIG